MNSCLNPSPRRPRVLYRGLPRLLLSFLFATSLAHAQESSPITITPEIHAANGERRLILHLHIPEHNHLYAQRLSVEVAGQPANAILPPPVMEMDKYSSKTVGVYTKDFTASVPLASAVGDLQFAVNLQGCNDAECFFLETRTWTIHPDQTVVSSDAPHLLAVASSDTSKISSGFQITRRASGFLSKSAFLAFLDQSAGAVGPAAGTSSFAGIGALATILLILLGGLALNLTPCVLPMIPINLAILGAGVNGGNRRRGVALGGAYGLGMALAYGGLGLAVVLTGSKFGTLNSSSWFNFGIAIVFVVLGLAMFDKIAINLSRFQRGGVRKKSGNAAFLGAALMGSISALLAGACVAPVVISVLLLAATSYQQGKPLGLLYPFVLGLGMALPWPFAAGGLSFLPKPGRWMMRVKYGFGLLIFAFALWYGWLGWNLTRMDTVNVTVREGSHGVDELRSALKTSRATGKPVLVDFWASWCKNCEVMEHTTFRDQAVRDRLKNFQVVRFEAEHLDDASIKPILDEFGVLGLPAFVVLHPNNKGSSNP